MRKSKDTAVQERGQYAVFIGLSVLVLVLAAGIYSVGRASFQRFLGGANPLAVLVAVFVLESAALHLLHSRFGFVLFRRGNWKGLLLSSGLSVPLAAVIILVDLRGYSLPTST